MEHTRTKIFQYVLKRVKSGDGFPPFQDIADSIGISKSTAHYHVKMLEEKNIVLVDPVSGSYKIAPKYLETEGVN